MVLVVQRLERRDDPLALRERRRLVLDADAPSRQVVVRPAKPVGRAGDRVRTERDDSSGLVGRRRGQPLRLRQPRPVRGEIQGLHGLRPVLPPRPLELLGGIVFDLLLGQHEVVQQALLPLPAVGDARQLLAGALDVADHPLNLGDVSLPFVDLPQKFIDVLTRRPPLREEAGQLVNDCTLRSHGLERIVAVVLLDDLGQLLVLGDLALTDEAVGRALEVLLQILAAGSDESQLRL